MTSVDRPRVVILGGGFAGSAARAFGRIALDVTLIDRHDYHLFQPLLYQVATAALAPNTIAAPILAILRRQTNATVLMETVTGIDTADRAVVLGEHRVVYDFLIVATGAHHSYFGHDEWEKFAPGIKTLFDALAIRQQILSALEAAEFCEDPDPNLINPWGVAFSPKSPFWVNNNHTGRATTYNVDPTTDATKAASLVVTIAPPTGTDITASPTGIVFNSDPNGFILNGNPARSSWTPKTAPSRRGTAERQSRGDRRGRRRLQDRGRRRDGKRNSHDIKVSGSRS
jgi:hypothetical protein